MDNKTESPEEKYNTWKQRVIEFATEDEPLFTPNEDLLKELWEWGSPSGGAADDCVNRFRKDSQS